MNKKNIFLIFAMASITIACDKIDKMEITSDPQTAEKTAKTIPPICDEFLVKSLACMKKYTPSLEMQKELDHEDKVRRARWAATPYEQMEESCKKMLDVYHQQASKSGC